VNGFSEPSYNAFPKAQDFSENACLPQFIETARSHFAY